MIVRQIPHSLALPSSLQGARPQAGFSLVEMMVGIVLGLLSVLLISHVFVNAEAHKRSATSGSDAQLNGALALYALQRDIQMSGYGLAANPAALGCSVRGRVGATVLTPFTLAPVVITPGASDGPDTITLFSSSKSGYSLPMYVSENHPTASNFFVVRSSLGTEVGDILLAIPQAWDGANWCSLFAVTSDGLTPATTLTATNIPHATGDSWNHVGTTVFPIAGYAAASTLVNLGQISYRRYSISATQALQVTTLSATDGSLSAQELHPQIVTMKALYGRDVGATGSINNYSTTTPVTAANWAEVVSIRVAVVARSGQREKEIVTSSNPVWDVGSTGTTGLGGATCGTSRCLTLKVGDPLSVTDTEWKYYRYKVYDTVIPLRNMLWNS